MTFQFMLVATVHLLVVIATLHLFPKNIDCIISSRYKFDMAFPPSAGQEELFEGTAKSLVEDVFKVDNCLQCPE